MNYKLGNKGEGTEWAESRGGGVGEGSTSERLWHSTNPKVQGRRGDMRSIAEGYQLNFLSYIFSGERSKLLQIILILKDHYNIFICSPPLSRVYYRGWITWIKGL
jgi:hypothetical protein